MKHDKLIKARLMATVIAAAVLLAGCNEYKETPSGIPSNTDSSSQTLSENESSDNYIPDNSSQSANDSEPQENSETDPSDSADSNVSSVQSSTASSSSSSASSSKPSSSSSSSVSSTKPASSSSSSVSSSKSSSSSSSSSKSSSSSSSSSKSSSSSSSSSKSSSSSSSSSKSSSSSSSSSKSSSSSSSSSKSSSSSSSSSKSSSSSSSSSTTPELSSDKIYNILISFKEKYPEGTPWTNETRSYFSSALRTTGFGCAAFAFELSDAVFGSLPGRQHNNISEIRVGDILRVNYGGHSVVVLEVNSNGVVIAEGNYNSSVHWGRTITNEQLQKELTYILTRYPQ